ncbi:MAG: hypothetical protein EOM41_08120 [Bacilli bacterium]|nr:hypothetical protein [Bacilli bacterium]
MHDKVKKMDKALLEELYRLSANKQLLSAQAKYKDELLTNLIYNAGTNQGFEQTSKVVTNEKGIGSQLFNLLGFEDLPAEEKEKLPKGHKKKKDAEKAQFVELTKEKGFEFGDRGEANLSVASESLLEHHVKRYVTAMNNAEQLADTEAKVDQKQALDEAKSKVAEDVASGAMTEEEGKSTEAALEQAERSLQSEPETATPATETTATNAKVEGSTETRPEATPATEEKATDDNLYTEDKTTEENAGVTSAAEDAETETPISAEDVEDVADYEDHESYGKKIEWQHKKSTDQVQPPQEIPHPQEQTE